MAKKSVVVGGKAVEGSTVPFKVESEPWCEYQCEDGTKIRLKVVVSEIVRLEGMYSPDGDPVYWVKSSNVVSTEVPDSLRKKNPGPAGGPSGQYV